MIASRITRTIAETTVIVSGDKEFAGGSESVQYDGAELYRDSSTTPMKCHGGRIPSSMNTNCLVLEYEVVLLVRNLAADFAGYNPPVRSVDING